MEYKGEFMEKQMQEFCDFVKNLLAKEVGHGLDIEDGRKYVKLVSNRNGSRSVWCFVDKATGSIFKPASWKAPAKHARGNILVPESYSDYQWTGPHYLR